MTTNSDTFATQQQNCFLEYETFNFNQSTTYCNSTYDGFLCWPPTPAAQTTRQHCPDVHLSDAKQFAYRRCGADGVWAGRHVNDTGKTGWTNYTPCFPPLVQSIFNEVYDEGSDAQAKFDIAQSTRYLEIVGFSLSLIALLISLYIFIRYRALHNHRTRIHKNLFIAMLGQVIIRLVLYIDQEIARSYNQHPSKSYTVTGIDTVPYLCEFMYVLLEYTVSGMFVWFFIEGFYLHNLVTANALREKISYLMYCICGWVCPGLITAAWAVVTALHYKVDFELKKCWYGYNFLNIYWIAQGPRFAIIAINLYFLLNILKTLIGKLNNSQTSEITKMKKAAKAGLVLIPLLGITNVLNMVEPPLNGNIYYFAIWCYTTHFLRSFQGYLVAMIYCFLNMEVRQVIAKHWENYKAVREYRRRGDSFREMTRRPRATHPRPLAATRWPRISSGENEIEETEFGGNPAETRPVSCCEHRAIVHYHADNEPSTSAQTDTGHRYPEH